MRRRSRANVEALEPLTLLSGPSLGGPLPPAASPSGLSVTLTTDRSSYPLGQPVTMTLTETNISSHVVSVADGPSIDGFSVTQRGVRVWASNAGVKPLFIALIPLQPHQSFTRTAVWDGKSNLGSSYLLHGTEMPLAHPTGPFVVKSQVPGARSVTIPILPKSATTAGLPHQATVKSPHEGEGHHRT